ncbi:hypothetical protein [Microbulbifer sp. ARAS458-1]|uniref:hypothetical protein n=1 Tax=Microbulbifer sp. ARAS458-1 TaxID=3140242 RepID=UPI003877C307
MKLRLIAPFAAAFFAGCAGTASNIDNVKSLDGFWCDLTGSPATYYQGRLPENLTPLYPRDCFSGDTQIPTANACLTGDSVCYQLDTGNWCTAGIAPQCPVGSAPLTMDAPCPEGGQCRIYSEGLRCYSSGA